MKIRKEAQKQARETKRAEKRKLQREYEDIFRSNSDLLKRISASVK